MPFGLGKKHKKLSIDTKAPDGPGQTTLPNPGELPPDWEQKGTPLNSLGHVPTRGSRAGGGDFLDDGARVGYLRNLEFSAGGRSQLLSTGTSSPSRPFFNEATGQVHISTAQEGDPAGSKNMQTPAQAGAEPEAGHPPAHADNTLTQGENLDSNASTGPERRVDRRGV